MPMLYVFFLNISTVLCTVCKYTECCHKQYDQFWHDNNSLQSFLSFIQKVNDIIIIILSESTWL